MSKAHQIMSQTMLRFAKILKSQRLLLCELSILIQLSQDKTIWAVLSVYFIAPYSSNDNYYFVAFLNWYFSRSILDKMKNKCDPGVQKQP